VLPEHETMSENPLLAGIAAGRTVGPFHVVRLIGRGGMGTVYEAFEPGLDRRVALKILPAASLHEEAFARRFNQEARVIASLEHPNIVPIYASGIDDGSAWLSMRLLSGGTLSDLLTGGPLNPERTVSILRGVARALDHAHARGVVHRDVKPGNILLDDDGNACVADFGLARLMEGGSAFTRVGVVVGTPQYMAPEQALGGEIDHRCDIYGLGIVAFEMLDGAPPFIEATPLATLMKHVREPVPSPARAGVSRAAIEVLHKALAKEPRDRWASASEFVDALAIGLQTPAGSRTARRVVVTLAAAILAGAAFYWPRAVEPPEISSPPSAAPAPIDPPPADPIVSVPTDKPAVSRRTGPRAPKQQTTENPAPTTPPAAGANPSATVEAGSQPPKPSPPPIEPARGVVAPDKTLEPQPKPNPPVPAPPAPDTVIPPRVIGQVVGVYPPIAIAGGFEGEVFVRAVCEIDGRLTNARVVKSREPVFNQSAVDAILKSKCAPQVRNGKPEAAELEHRVEFRLK
jgi:TonB family protein